MAGPLRIGLTGGIASGKTAVADMFSARGVGVIDTDVIARAVVAPGQPGLAAVTAAFGTSVLHTDGSLNRRKLRRQVFDDPEARQRLEQILHPLIRAATLEQATTLIGPYQLIVVPLLTETGFDVNLDRVLVVDCPSELQLERLMRRDQITESAARKILAAQADRTERLQIADDVITNDGSMADLESAVDRFHAMYQELAAQAGNQLQ